MVSVATSQLCPRGAKAATGNTLMIGCDSIPVKLYLQKNRQQVDWGLLF